MIDLNLRGKLIILAGGISSRMKNSAGPDSEINSRLLEDALKKSKGMIRLGEGERPFLDYLLFNAREAGYTDIVIVIGVNDDSIKEYYQTKPFNGLKISYAVQNIPDGFTKPLGTADALYCALKSKPDWRDSQFTMCNSDNLYSQYALSLMLRSDYKNAMIDYDRSGLEVEEERIAKFAVTKKDEEGFLTDIIEKPSVAEVESVKGSDGFIGVSMNLFRFNYEMIFPFLDKVPLHPVRNEKELPAAIKMMILNHPKSLFCNRLKEHVPDLTSKSDIIAVKNYLEKQYPNLSF